VYLDGGDWVTRKSVLLFDILILDTVEVTCTGKQAQFKSAHDLRFTVLL
jgi:hypothetical protein